MSETLKNFGKFLLAGIVWVFILSVPVGGQPLFFPLRSLIVRNPVVTFVGKEINTALIQLKVSLIQTLRSSGEGETAEI